MITDDHFHPESIEKFTTALGSAGFQLVAGSSPPRWTGTIHPAFGPLTDAATMDIVIAPGWPFQPPAVFVQGLNTNHSTLDGLVCMWQDGDFSHDWTTVEGLFSRIEEWCEKAKQGWEGDHLAQDAFLNFQTKYALVATFDLAALGVSEGSWGDLNGVVNPDPLRVDIGHGRSQSSNQLRGMWFHVGPLRTPPPRQLAEVSLCLPRPQRRGLQRALDERLRPEALVASGGVDLILFLLGAARSNRPVGDGLQRDGRTSGGIRDATRAKRSAQSYSSCGARRTNPAYSQGSLVRCRSLGWAHGDAARRKRCEVPGDRRPRRPVTWQRGQTRSWPRPSRCIQGSSGQCRDQRSCALDRGYRLPRIAPPPQTKCGSV